MESYNTNPEAFQVEPLDPAKILQEIHTVAQLNGWQREPAKNKSNDFFAYKRTSTSAQKRVYISAGIHGNEPAGPMAILEMLKDNAWPEGMDVFLCPCLNPKGLVSNTRENELGIDQNLDYREPQAPATKLHIDWLNHAPNFDVALCLHENWEATGVFLYETNVGGQSFARKIIMRVAEVCSIDRSPEIRGQPAQNGVVLRLEDAETKPQWSEANFLLGQKTRLIYTLVTPSNRSLSMRVNTFKKAVGAVFDGLKSA
jgi:protein MpaA